MSAQGRVKPLLLGGMFFLIVVLGYGLSYYYGRDRRPDAGAPGAVTRAPLPVAPQPGIAGTPRPGVSPGRAPGETGGPRAKAGAASGPEREEEPAASGRIAPQSADAGSRSGVPEPSGDIPAPREREGAAHQPSGAAALSEADAEDAGARRPEAADNAPPVVLYGKGRPVTPEGGVVRGDIPRGQNRAGARIPPGGQDSVIGALFVRSLAKFLVESYWPAGSHPMARERGISTAGVKWLNHRYGAQLHGFAADPDNPVAARQRVLRYAFMPSMLRALYELYGERFYETLHAEAGALKRGPENLPLTSAQKAELFALYADMAGNLAKTVRAYVNAPRIRPLVASFAEAEQEASAAFADYIENLENADVAIRPEKSRAYQIALKRREKAEEALVAALRQEGGGQGFDADSLVYIAQWLYRRGEDSAAALSVLAGILEDCAMRLSSLGLEYRARPADAVYK